MSKRTSRKPVGESVGLQAATHPAKPTRVYITAPRLSQATPIRQALEAKGATTFSPDELNLPTQNLTEVMREALEQADLVVALVDSTKASNFVFFELGVAQGMKKPTVVLLTMDASPDTWIASGIPYLRFDPLKPSSLDFGIDQILKVPHHGVKQRPALGKQTHPIGRHADVLLSRLRSADRSTSEQDFEAIIADAIQASGVAVVSRNQQAEKGVDLAVWSDDLSPWVGNPLLVELKLRPGGSDGITAGVRALERGLSGGGLYWGLLIYHDNSIDPSTMETPLNVLTLSAEAFIKELRTTGFGDLVRRLRNQRVHGGL